MPPSISAWVCLPLATVTFLFFFFNDTATTEIYTLSLHDALPIWSMRSSAHPLAGSLQPSPTSAMRSEEHTSELQSHLNLVCRLLLEKTIDMKHTQLSDSDVNAMNAAALHRGAP